jgi:hypothetical protein
MLARLKPEHEIGWETCTVTSDLLQESLCLDAVQLRKVLIEYDLVASDDVNPKLDRLGGNRASRRTRQLIGHN